jgi:hypothetical protein
LREIFLILFLGEKLDLGNVQHVENVASGLKYR